MITCKQATRLMSEEQERSLSLRERLALHAHNMMCKGCSNYREHMVFLRKVAERFRSGGQDGG